MPQDDDKVRVQRPDGRFSRIPRESLQGAMGRGYKLAPSDAFLQGQKEQQETVSPSTKHANETSPFSFENIEGEAFKRELGAAGEAIKGVVTAPYHAVADPLTPEQEKRYGPDSLMKRIGTAPARMAAEPIADAAIWYKNAIQGKIPDPVGQALSVGPEAIGTGGGTVVGGKLGEVAGRTALQAPKGASSALRIAGQEMAGAGKEPVYLEKIKREAIAKERAQRYAESAQKVAAENQQKLQEHAGKVNQAKSDYQKAVQEYQAAEAGKKSAHAEKVKALRKDWVKKSYEAKKLQQEHAKVQGRLETLKRGQQEYAKIIKDNAESTHEAVRSSLNSRWGQLNTALGKEPVNSVAVQEAIEVAKEKYLMGSPENMKVFNDLTRQMSGDEEMGIPRSQPLTWEEGRVHYSALGDKMYSGDLPGNVYKALGYVRDSLDEELSSVAKAKGAGRAYSSVKADWSKYMDDWRDMRSLSVGGSPLARVLKAQDPGFVEAQVTGKAGERMAETLGRYKQFGGNPTAVAKYRAMGSQVKALPKIKAPSAPEKLELPAEPKAGEAPEMKQVGPPKLGSASKPRPVEDVDPVAVRRKKLVEMAGRPFRFYDLFPPYLIEHLAAKNPAIREWLATQPRNELK